MVEQGELSGPVWTLDQAGAAEIAGAAAVIWALAWGLRLVVRGVFNLK
jgi:hypothetical protein